MEGDLVSLEARRCELKRRRADLCRDIKKADVTRRRLQEEASWRRTAQLIYM